MSAIVQKIKNLSFAEVILYASFVMVGLFHVYLSCAVSVALLIWVCVRAVKQKSLTVTVDYTFIAILVMVVGYLITAFWAVDKGAAIFGFFKFLPLLLYTLALMQTTHGKEKVIGSLPYAMTVMTVVAMILMWIPALADYFAVAGRLSGFVQYPNSFAIMILVAELLLITKERVRIWDYLCIVVLLAGLLYTGSRTVFVLAAVANLIALFINKNKKLRWIVLGCIALGIAAVLLYCVITGNYSVITRYLRISASESTFVGRLLYAQDALPVILANPFGIGYMGYHYIQQSVQTGVYAVMFVHNDLLQILLDVGWVPFVLFALAIVMTFINKNLPVRYKLIVAVVLLHSCFDFDLQFVSIFMMLMLFMTSKEIKQFTLTPKKPSLISLTALFTCLCLYAGTVQGLIRFEKYDAVRALYNFDTAGDMELLKETDDVSEANEIADRLIERNEYVTLAYSVKARYAYSLGDFQNVIKYKNKAINNAPFVHNEYWEYGYMLMNGIKLYERAGDTKSAEICKEELLRISRALPDLKNKLSKFGASISLQPRYYFPKDLSDYIKTLEADEQ